MDCIRVGFATGLMAAFAVIANQLTHGGIVLLMTDWLKLFGG